ncbi:hypothetical protein AXF42_Ash004723 [Apostasia shenzhenica]|uniref:Pulmonary surfactant-associated protein B n=1 Tax=Apostasia shenzhenica TaxID=1088818 RepID=A0A2I0BHF6_9ASPA|nr:hypothetical protein AXF42_Ash004723 [Apostasia shenzhenica]
MNLKVAFTLLIVMILGSNYVEANKVQHSDITATPWNKQLCELCEDFIAKTLYILNENETQIEIMDSLHQVCTHFRSFKQQCISLVDYHVPLFFSEIAKLQPNLLCEKVKLCDEISLLQQVRRNDPCTLCHNVVNQILAKLDDPDLQLEIIQTLLKVCNQADTYANKCKKLVLEYAPIILANTEKFFEKTDVCTAMHVCKSHTVAADIGQQFLSAAA